MKALVYIKGNPDIKLIVPDSAITRAVNPFFPPSAAQWKGTLLRGVRINRLGKGILPAFAQRYYAQAVSAVLNHADNEPFDALATGCDGALVVSDPVTVDTASFTDYWLNLIDDAIALFSSRITLKSGDLILIGNENAPTLNTAVTPSDHNITPDGVFPGFRLKIR